MKHLCLPAAESTHSYKMSSRASSNGERLTLIHKQLPLSLCCRFRTAVPPNPFPAWQKEKKKKEEEDSTSAFSPQKQRQTQKQGGKGKPSQIKSDGKKTKQKRSSGQEKKGMQFLVFYVNEIAGWHTSVFCEWKQGLSASARQSLGMAWSYPMRSQLDDSFRGG